MNNLELEIPDCPMCGNTEGVIQYKGEKFSPYTVKKCSQCELSYLTPRPTEREMLSLYKKDQYFSSEDDEGYGDYATQSPALRATFRRLLQNLAARGKTGGELLEIGCGYGYLLEEAKPYFSRRVGTDFSIGAVRQAQERADRVYQGGVDAVAETELFDCVIATHVIEHVYHPRAFIDALLLRLRPGGCLLIAAPDMGSFWRKLMGARWPSFKLPEHVLYFDERTLPRLLNECGIKKVEKVSYPHAFPLPLIASKLGIGLPTNLNCINLWMPATTVAFMGVKVD